MKVKITNTVSCWKDWLGLPSPSALETQTVIIVTQADRTSSDRFGQMFPFSPVPHSPKAIGETKPNAPQTNPALIEIRDLLSPSSHSFSALMPLPLHVCHGFDQDNVLSVNIDSSAYAWALWCCPCMRQLRQHSPGQWHTLLSQFPVESTSQSKSASAQQNQCFPGWSQSNK